MDKALAVREEVLKKSGCSFSCDITADYGDILYQFTLDCSADNLGNISFTVSKPESISGIIGSITNETGKIRFDDSVVGFPLLSERLPTPVSAPWLFISGLRNGYIRSCDDEEGKLEIVIADTYEQDPILMIINTNEQNVPVSCEFLWEGRRILSMQIHSFTYV